MWCSTLFISSLNGLCLSSLVLCKLGSRSWSTSGIVSAAMHLLVSRELIESKADVRRIVMTGRDPTLSPLNVLRNATPRGSRVDVLLTPGRIHIILHDRAGDWFPSDTTFSQRYCNSGRTGARHSRVAGRGLGEGLTSLTLAAHRGLPHLRVRGLVGRILGLGVRGDVVGAGGLRGRSITRGRCLVAVDGVGGVAGVGGQQGGVA